MDVQNKVRTFVLSKEAGFLAACIRSPSAAWGAVWQLFLLRTEVAVAFMDGFSYAI